MLAEVLQPASDGSPDPRGLSDPGSGRFQVLANAVSNRCGFVVVVLMSVMIMTGCTSPQVEILSAQSSIDDARLQILLSSCDATLGIEVAEEPDTVELTVIDLDAPAVRLGTGDCRDDRIVELSQPLSGRTVIDSATGKVVGVEPPAEIPENDWPYDRAQFTELEYEDALAATVSCIEAADETLDAYVYQSLDWMDYGWEKKPQGQGESKEPAELVEELPTARAVDPCQQKYLDPLR